MRLYRRCAPLSVWLAACGSDTTEVPPPDREAASVEISPASATLLELDSIALTVTVRDAQGRPIEGRQIQWESSDLDVAAEPSADGYLRVLRAGTAVLTARVAPEGVIGTAEITVHEQPVASVVISPALDSIMVGGSSPLVAKALDPHGRHLWWREITWATSDPAVVGISDGDFRRFRGVSAGTATISASSGGKTGTATVEVLLVRYAGLSVGHDHSCGRATDGGWFCWGADGLVGQMLRTSAVETQDPRRMQTGLHFDTLVASVHYGTVLESGPVVVCGIAGGAAYCWGQDDAGQVGDGPGAQSTCRIFTNIDSPDFTFDCASEPRLVAGGLAWREIAAGGSTTCGVTTAGAAYCWGSNEYGQLGGAPAVEQCRKIVSYEFGGADDVPCSTTPASVAGGHVFTHIAAGARNACALTADGQAWCWGDNSLGQLGNGSTMPSSTPVPVAGDLRFRQIAMSGAEACAVTLDGDGYCWGHGALGSEPDDDACSQPCLTSPTAIAGNLEIAVISPGDAHACAVTTGGAGYCWGLADLGMLGVPREACTDGFYCTAPIAVSGGHVWAAIQAGNEHTCGLATGGVIYCWGSGFRGQLGVTAVDTSSVPIRIMGQP